MKGEEKNVDTSSIKKLDNLSGKSLDSVSGGRLFIGSSKNENVHMQNSHNTDNSKTVIIGDGATVNIGGKLDM